MVRWVLLLVFLALVGRDSRACIIFLEEEPSASTAVALTVAQALQQHESRATWQSRADQIRQIADKQWDFRTQNNLGAALVHAGHLDEALDRMQTVERAYPGQRETASNLGTVYELKGDLPRAKFWIAEGIRREEKATGRATIDGTEWLHLRILDAEMSRLKNRDGAGSVSGVDFGTSRLPTVPISLPTGNSGARLSLLDVQNALREQLHERLEFVQAPNPIVGQLLFDFANTFAVAGDSDEARDIYQLAIPFAPLSASMAQRRFDYYAGTPNYPLQITLWTLGFGAVGCYFGRKKWLEVREWQAMPIQKFEDEPPFTTAHIDCSKYDPFDRS